MYPDTPEVKRIPTPSSAPSLTFLRMLIRRAKNPIWTKRIFSEFSRWTKRLFKTFRNGGEFSWRKMPSYSNKCISTRMDVMYNEYSLVNCSPLSLSLSPLLAFILLSRIDLDTLKRGPGGHLHLCERRCNVRQTCWRYFQKVSRYRYF